MDLFSAISTWHDDETSLEDYLLRQKMLSDWLYGDSDVSLDQVEDCLYKQGIDPYQWSQDVGDNFLFLGVA